MQQDAAEHHPRDRRRAAGGGAEQAVAHDPRQHAEREHPLDAQAREERRHDHHEQHFGPLAEGHVEAGVVGPDQLRELVAEAVVAGERDADEERAHQEHRERRLLQQRQRAEAERLGQRRALAGGRRRRVRQDPAEQRHRCRAVAGDEEHHRLGVGLQELADEGDRRDPAERAEHARDRELLLRVGHVAERHRVRQPERRHVAEHVRQQVPLEPRRIVCLDRTGDADQHDQRADGVHRSEHALRCEVAVGDQAEEQRRDQRRDRPGRVSPADGRHWPLGGVDERASRLIPAPPDEELEEHHRAQEGELRHGAALCRRPGRASSAERADQA